MIEIRHAQVFGTEAAVYNARNPMNSWDKSDSGYCKDFECSENCPLGSDDNYCGYCEKLENHSEWDGFMIGKNDLALLTRLVNAGPDHGKFLRMIHVQANITAPLYWWKEMDQYKIGTTTNSCSTMHTIHKKEFELNDFSWDQLLNNGCDLFELRWKSDFSTMVQPQHFLIEHIIPVLNICREKYLETKDKKYWWQIIQLLPSSYNQMRTWDANYAVLRNIYHARKNHKLDEWKKFCEWIESLPYASEFIIGNGDKK